jgi:hypothetical protein
MASAPIEGCLAQLQQDNPDTYGPELVLSAARPEDSPLHAFVFDRTMAEAAEEYYLERAAVLVRSVHVTIIASDGTPRRVRAYHAIPAEAQPYVFVPVAVLMTDPLKLGAARTEAIRRVLSAQNSVDDLDALTAGNSYPTKKAKARLAEAAEALAALT